MIRIGVVSLFSTNNWFDDMAPLQGGDGQGAGRSAG
jgi:hypothetical protein